MHALLALILALGSHGSKHDGSRAHGPKGPAAATWTNSTSTLFDGTNDYATCGEPADMAVNMTANERVICVWVKPAVVNTLNSFISKAQPGVPNMTFLFGGNTDGSIYGYYGNTANTASAASALTQSAWQHVCWDVRNVTGTYKGRLWRNGVQQAPGFEATAQNNTTAGVPIIFGASGSAGTVRFFNGKVDEATMWGTGFDSADFLALYNSGVTADPRNHSKAANLLHWWRFGDGDTYPTVTDRIGSANCTLTNMTSAGVNFVADAP